MRGRIIYTVGSRGEPVSPFVNLGSTGNSHYVPANQRWNVSAARRRFNNPACLLAGKGPIQDPRELLEQRHWAFVHIPGRTSRGQLPSLIRNKRELVPPLCFLLASSIRNSRTIFPMEKKKDFVLLQARLENVLQFYMKIYISHRCINDANILLWINFDDIVEKYLHSLLQKLIRIERKKERKKKERRPVQFLFSFATRKKRNATYSIKKEKEGRQIKVGRWRGTRANVAFHRRSFFLLPFSPVLSSASREFHMDDIHSGASHGASWRVSSRGFFSTSSSNVDSIRERRRGERERERENRQKDCSSGGTDAPLTWSRMRDDDDERYSRIKMWTEGIKITGRRLSRR